MKLKSRRIDEIEVYVKRNGIATIEELTSEFNDSINTIRRDISEITRRENSVFEKIYGGIKVKNDTLASINFRYNENYNRKQEIAQKAVQLVENNDIIFMDSGITTSPIVKYINKELKFTVITNNLEVVEQAYVLPKVNLLVVGSVFQRKTKSLTSVDNEVVLSRFNINKAFLATTGVSLKNGVTNSIQGEYLIKKTVVQESEKKILLADHTKFDKSALFTYANIDEIDTIITDAKPSEDYMEYFKKDNVTLI